MKLPVTKYHLGDIVYHRCADDSRRGMVTTIQYNLSGGGIGYIYGVTWGCNANQHYHFERELTTEFVPDFHGHGSVDIK